jgi:hypothetical protein
MIFARSGATPQALRTGLSVLHEEPGAIKRNRICANRTDALGKPSVFRAFVQRGKQQED